MSTAGPIDWWCVNQAVADFSRIHGRLPAEKLLVIPNGIDAARYVAVSPTSADALKVPSGRRWITYVGRLDPQKGLEWLLHEADRWLAPLADYDLLLVGDGPLRVRLEDIVRARGLAGRVHFTGWRSDVPGILAASDVLLLPSRWEGMPNVVLEAMASGRPVLAADVEGVRELLGDDAAAQVAPPGDAEQWTEKLRLLATDRELAMLLGARNRRRVAEHFTLAKAAQAYAARYTSLARPMNAAPGR